MTQQPDFGDLRSLMNEPYSRQIWDQLCLWVEQWPHDDLHARVLPYLEGHLHQWSDAQRFFPKRWVQKLMEGSQQEHPEFQIARLLSLRSVVEARWGDTDDAKLLQSFSSRALSHVKILDVSYNAAEARTYAALFACEQLHALQELRLVSSSAANKNENAGWFEGFASAPFVAQLRALDLRDNALTLEELSPLFSRTLPNMQSLLLGKNELDLALFPKLTETLPALKSLQLSHMDLSKSTFELLGLSALRHLELSTAQCDPATLESLKHATFAPALRTLQLWGCEQSADFVSVCEAESRLSALHDLTLAHCGLQDAHMERLVESPGFAKLRALSLPGNALTQRGARALLAALPHSQLESLNLRQNPAIPSPERDVFVAYAQQNELLLTL